MAVNIAQRSAPEPERVLVKLAAVGGVEEKDGGYVYKALAQAYGKVNDRLMIFRQGSAAKTIAERVPAGRVKIHDGHPWIATSKTTIGKVLEATEGPEGVTYAGFLSAEEESVATKLAEGVLDENSIELYVLREDRIEVPLDEVPVIARRWADLSPTGNVYIREIQEWMWLAVGLVGASSQGIPCLLDPPRLVPYQDLPLASSATPWDPDGAATRLAAWAGSGSAATPKLARAYLARGGKTAGQQGFVAQIADVVDGELVVVPEALERAYAALEQLLPGDPQTLAAAARQIGRYEARLLTAPAASPKIRVDPGQQAGRLASAEPPATGLAAAQTGTTAPAPLYPAAPGLLSQSPPTGRDGDDAEHLARETALRELQIEALRLELPSTGG